MNKERIKVMKLVQQVLDKLLIEIIDFIEYFKYAKKEKFKDLAEASESGLGFWINEEDEGGDNI